MNKTEQSNMFESELSGLAEPGLGYNSVVLAWTTDAEVARGGGGDEGRMTREQAHSIRHENRSVRVRKQNCPRTSEYLHGFRGS
jgi:hypothetical protein